MKFRHSLIGILVLTVGFSPAAEKIAIKKTPNDGIQPKLARDSRGTLHLIYFKGDPMGGNVYYVNQKPGATMFSKAIRVNSVAGSVVAVGTMRGAQLTLGRNGRPHVSWNASPKFTKARSKSTKKKHNPKDHRFLFYTRMNSTGKAFEKQRNLMGDTFALDGGCVVTADAKGNVYVVWHATTDDAEHGEVGRAVYMVSSKDGGKTFSKVKRANVKDTGACGCCALTAMTDKGGNLYVTYRSAIEKMDRDTFLLVSKDGGKSFSESIIDRWRLNACPGSSYAMIETGSGVYAAWESRRQIFFGKIGDEIKKIPAAGKGGGRKTPAMAVNSDGQLLLVWNDGGGWRHRSSLAWQLYDSSGNPQSDHGFIKNGNPVWSFGTPVVMADGSFVIYH